MPQKLPRKDVVIIGLGWTGSILAQELTDEGLDVVAIERGSWRDTASDFPPSCAPDELRYCLRHELFHKPAPLAAPAPAMRAGAAIYANECSACHTPTGSGIAGLISTLVGSAAVQSREPTSLLHVVLRGARSVGTGRAPTAPAMPSYEWLLTDDEIVFVTTYGRNAWGNAAPAVNASEVASARKAMARTDD